MFFTFKVNRLGNFNPKLFKKEQDVIEICQTKQIDKTASFRNEIKGENLQIDLVTALQKLNISLSNKNNWEKKNEKYKSMEFKTQKKNVELFENFYSTRVETVQSDFNNNYRSTLIAIFLHIIQNYITLS